MRRRGRSSPLVTRCSINAAFSEAFTLQSPEKDQGVRTEMVRPPYPYPGLRVNWVIGDGIPEELKVDPDLVR